jgi:beta-glucosidase
MDNFEWANGQAERYGLIFADYRDQKRTTKDLGYWYGKAAASNGLEV